MRICPFEWRAPYWHEPPGKKVTFVKQRCSLPEGHDGPHRSLSNVIKDALRAGGKA